MEAKSTQLWSFATTAMELLDSNMMESEVTSILTAIVLEEYEDIQQFLGPLGWSDNGFKRPLSRSDIELLIASHLPTPPSRTLPPLQHFPPKTSERPIRSYEKPKVVVPSHGLHLILYSVTDVWAYVRRKGLEHKDTTGKTKRKVITLDDVLYILLKATASDDITETVVVGNSLDKELCNTFLQCIDYPVVL